MHPISQVKSVGEKMEAFRRWRKRNAKDLMDRWQTSARDAGSTADREVTAKIEMWCAGREAGGFLSTNR